MMNADPFKSFYKMVHAGIFAHCARYMCERDDEEGPPPTAMALPHQQYRSVAGGSTTSSSRRSSSSSSNKRHHQQAPSESGGSRKSTKRSKGKSEAGGSTSGSSKSRRAHHHQQHESQPSPVRIPTSPAEMSEDDLALLLVNPDTGRLLKESERALVPNYLPLSEDESVDEQQQQQEQQQQLQQQLMALMVTSADEEGAPPRLQSDAALISIRQTILVVAHRSRDSCLHAVVQTIRGNVLLHVFSPNNLVNAALQSYNDFVQERWIMRILRQYRLLLTLDEIEAAEYFRQQYFSGAPGSPNQDIQMLSIVLSRAVNHACETLPIPRLRFCCKIMTVPGDVALLLLYPIHLEGSAYIMAEALKNLSGTLNVVLELTSVRIQQKLMNLHHHNLLSVFSHTISRMTPDGSVKGPGDAGPWLIETQRHKDKCEDEAVRLIARWHEENIRLRGMVQ